MARNYLCARYIFKQELDSKGEVIDTSFAVDLFDDNNSVCIQIGQSFESLKEIVNEENIGRFIQEDPSFADLMQLFGEHLNTSMLFNGEWIELKGEQEDEG